MIHASRRPGARPLAALFVLALAVATLAPAPPARAADPKALWASATALHPAELAAMLRAPKGEKPLLLHVGFRVLYRQGAIPGSRYVGPGSRPDGIASLKAAVKGSPANRLIVLYCGCCPWDHCPNMKPSFEALKAMGFTNVRPLFIPNNLETDWAGKGYPIAAPKD